MSDRDRFVTVDDVREVRQRMINRQAIACNPEAEALARRIRAKTDLSRRGINAAYAEARKRLEEKLA